MASIDIGVNPATVPTAAQIAETQQAFQSVSPSQGSDALGLILNALQDTSVALNINGDSTGNAEDEWVYRVLTEKVGPAMPNVCIRYALYNSGSDLYGIWQTLQEGGGQRYLDFDGTSYRSIQDDQMAPRTSADLETEFEVQLSDWTPASAIRPYGQSGNSGDRGWYVTVETSGSLVFRWSPDGTNLLAVSSTATGFADGQRARIRCKFDADNGSGSYNVKIDTSIDGGATWTNRANQTPGGTSSIFATTAGLSVGQVNGVGGFVGKVYDVVVRDGLNGPLRTPVAVEDFLPISTQSSYDNNLGGAPTLYVLNCSIPGVGFPLFLDTTRFPKINPYSSVQVGILSTGHNDVVYSGPKALAGAFDDYYALARARMPTAAFVVIDQNPRDFAEDLGKNFGENVRLIHRMLPALCLRNSVEFVSTYAAFLRAIEAGTPITTLVPDGIHPAAPAGVDVWMDELWRLWSARLWG